MTKPADNVPIVLIPDPSTEDVNELVTALVADNNKQAPRENHRKIAAFVRNEEHELVGGISGYTHWGWLFIGHLWVAESQRGKGYGQRLLETIEGAARERDCRKAWLDTFSFQAKPFYLANGYSEFGNLPDYPDGFARHFLWKRLDARSD